MVLKTVLGGRVYAFKNLTDVMAKANDEKSGDVLLGRASETVSERTAAKQVLSQLTLADFYENPLLPPESDEVSRVLLDDLNLSIYGRIKNWTIGELREWLLRHETSSEDILRLSRGIQAEVAAAVAKLMTAMDLVYAASKIRITATCATTIGLPGTLSFRCQPNHPADDIEGIIASVCEGVSYGSGDAILGINPVDDTADNTRAIMEATWDFIQKWNLPTQNCVLSHVTTQMAAVENGAPCCTLFQSVAGTEEANLAFGVTTQLLREAYDLIHTKGQAPGPNLLYFETGQGSEQSINADRGIDLMTLEARCYGYARIFKPFMVNNVSGFIGPETLYDGRQIIRASLEDHFMGKLLGIPMGMAPCYTNHTKINQDDQEMATMLLTMAGANYFMGVPVGDDVMLAYQDTSFHDDATLRELMGLKPAPEFFTWMLNHDLMDQNGRLTSRAGDVSIFY
ncbi:MAG: ethanolamine ammonia-lyase subunit EutB [Spirochaetaceae bacterium]|jgi:ethanolamine ammonia-lyase large subunit|nr:ethanolamine ammonia-lyase subunit EutB [Spirochaetaceae bacterium]